MARYLKCSKRQREEWARQQQERQEAERRLREQHQAENMTRTLRSRRTRRQATGTNGSDNDGRNAADETLDPAFIEQVQAFNRDLDEDPDRFFIIEALLDKRCDRNGNEEYLVRWQNYPPEYDSWEPRAELEQNSMDMINDFNNEQPKTDKQQLHCICRRPYTAKSGGMIQCFTCTEWYHFSCINMNMAEANSFARWHCDRCRTCLNLRNIIKRNKVSTLYGNTRLVDIEKEDPIEMSEDGQFLV
jgi:hypothetical protein